MLIDYTWDLPAFGAEIEVVVDFNVSLDVDGEWLLEVEGVYRPDPQLRHLDEPVRTGPNLLARPRVCDPLDDIITWSMAEAIAEKVEGDDDILQEAVRRYREEASDAPSAA